MDRLPNRLSLILCVVISVAATACPESTTNPIAPGVDGIINLGGGVDPTDGDTLEIRFYPETCSVGEYMFPENCAAIPGFELVSSPLITVQFPREIHLGPEGAGATSQQNWLVLAWISKSADASKPQPGEYYGIAPVELYDCTQRCNVTCYCGRIHDVVITIESLVE